VRECQALECQALECQAQPPSLPVQSPLVVTACPQAGGEGGSSLRGDFKKGQSPEASAVPPLETTVS